MATSSKGEALVVDDCPIQRSVGMALAAQCGFVISIAKNGKEAVDLFEAGQRYHLIIMDMEMPIMDGIEATKCLRDMGANCVIIGATACEDESKKTAFKEAGVTHLIDKPLKKEKLDDLI